MKGYKLFGGLLALSLMFTSLAPVYAIDTAGGTGDVPVELTQETTSFSVTVPTVLPVDVNANGVVSVATDNKIINNSFGPVEVKGVEVHSQNEWQLVDFETDFTQKKVGLKEFGFQINDSNVLVDGGCEAEFDVIDGNSEINFTYDANVAAQTTALNDVEIAQVVFTVGWYSNENNGSGNPVTLTAGLYDANDVLLCAWEDSGIDLEYDYSFDDPGTSVSSVIYNKYPETTKVIVGEGVQSLGNYSFAFCGDLTSIILPNSLKTIGDNVFSRAISLTHLEIPNGVTSIGSSIIELSGIKTVSLPDTLTSIGICAFSESELESIVIPDGVTSIPYGTFSNCHKLTSVVLGKNTTSIGENAFNNSGITSIELPNTLETIGNSAFYYCNRLTSINIPNSVTSIGQQAFYFCEKATSIKISNAIKDIGFNTFCGCDNVTSIIIPDGITSIRDSAFYHCDKLTSVVIPETVTLIDGFAFADCVKLETINYKGTEEKWGLIRTNDNWDASAGSETALGTYTIEYGYTE